MAVFRSDPATEFFTGLDLGQAADYSALVTLDRPAEDADKLRVRHIHRWPLGTPYPAVVADVKALFAAPPLAGSTLVVDGTGVGVAVVDMIREGGINAAVDAYTITCGLKPGDGTVPKKDLVGAVQVMLGNGRLKIAKDLPLAGTLTKELEAFRVKVTSERNETYGSWRERDHDDLVLALALAVWYATEHGGAAGCYAGDADATPFDSLHRDTFR